MDFFLKHVLPALGFAMIIGALPGFALWRRFSLALGVVFIAMGYAAIAVLA